MSGLIFRSKINECAIYTCACGCDVQIRVPLETEAEYSHYPVFYARNHAPIGCDPMRIWPAYDGTADGLTPEQAMEELVKETEDLGLYDWQNDFTPSWED